MAGVNERIRTPWSEFWRKFRRQPLSMAAGGFVLFLIVLGICRARDRARMTRKTTLTTT